MAEPARTIILIRHADVDGVAQDSTELNDDGRVRRDELVHVLADAGVGAILISPVIRSRQTARSIAQALAITPQEVAGAHLSGGEAAVVAAIQDLPPTVPVVLIVAHSHTLPSIIAGLDGPPIDDVGGLEFDRLFVLNGKRLIRSRYGTQSLPS
jgi:phosphohistidine phosphatase SixA